jgi:hypothetical protein
MAREMIEKVHLGGEPVFLIYAGTVDGRNDVLAYSHVIEILEILHS